MSKNILEIIVELTGQTPIQYSGELKAIICPFHDDQKPSLVIYEHTNSYFCYPCGFGGDVYNFYSKLKGCSYNAAKEALDGNADVLAEITEYLDGLSVKDEVDYNKQTNFAVSKYCRDLLYKRPELEGKIMAFLKKLDFHLQSGAINDILMRETILESRKLEEI